MSDKPNCCGFIIFNPKKTKTLLVCTPMNHLSFPKGKREKGETDQQTALRELQEETGIREDQFDPNYEKEYDECSKKGNLSIRYYVGILHNEINKFTFDSTELANVQWYDVNKVEKLDNLLDKRKEVFRQAYNDIK